MSLRKVNHLRNSLVYVRSCAFVCMGGLKFNLSLSRSCVCLFVSVPVRVPVYLLFHLDVEIKNLLSIAARAVENQNRKNSKKN